jgi:hypothetical protein
MLLFTLACSVPFVGQLVAAAPSGLKAPTTAPRLRDEFTDEESVRHMFGTLLFLSWIFFFALL